MEEYIVNEIIVSVFYPLHGSFSRELHMTSYHPSRNKHPLK